MNYIVCLSHTPWKARPNRTQQLLTRIGDVKILYFEPRHSARSSHHQGRQARPNISIHSLPTPYLPGSSLSMVRQRHRKKLATHIRQVMSRHRVREAVIWCTTPEAAQVAELLPRRCLVYDCWQEWPEEYVELESELTFASDVVFAASPGLVRRLSPCSDNIALIPNGANTLMLAQPAFPFPAALRSIPAPRFCRVGDVPEDLELDPLIQAARAHGEWTFLLLGRVAEGPRQQLRYHPNILLMEKVPAVEWPEYLFGCQVLFDLLRTSQRGGDIIPNRLFDYLATGKPVVTMVEPDAIEPFPDVTYTALDAAGFVRRCQSAVEEDNPQLSQRRREYAKHASWSTRAQEVARILSDVSFL